MREIPRLLGVSFAQRDRRAVMLSLESRTMFDALIDDASAASNLLAPPDHEQAVIASTLPDKPDLPPPPVIDPIPVSDPNPLPDPNPNPDPDPNPNPDPDPTPDPDPD